MMTCLRRWWTKKYNIPVTSDEWGRYYREDLIIEFLEDTYDNDEYLARKIRKKYLGLEIAPTGDPLIDMWERQIAEGQVPDLDACEDPRVKERDLAVARKHLEETGERFYIPSIVSDFEAAENWLASQKRRDPAEFDYDSYMGHNDKEELDQDMLDKVPAHAFDAFMNASGLLKK